MMKNSTFKTATTSSKQKYRLETKFSHQIFFLNAFLASPVTVVTPCMCFLVDNFRPIPACRGAWVGTNNLPLALRKQEDYVFDRDISKYG